MPIEVSLMDPAGSPPDNSERIPGVQAGQPVYFTLDALHDYRYHEAIVDPTPAENTAAGYPDRRMWVNTATQHVWFKVTEAAGSAAWVDLTAVATPGDVTNAFSGDVDGNGHRLFDILIEGFRDRPYDLATDTLGLNNLGAVTLVPGLNHVYHQGVTTALTVALPTPAAGEAPFGVFSFKLATGGSVALAASPAYEWEKVNPSDPDPTLPTVEGEGAHVYYRFDPVTERYVVNVTRLGEAVVPIGALQVVPDSWQTTAYSNQDTHPHAHNYASTTQDGTVYVIVGFISDATAAVEITPDSALTEIVTMSAAESDGTRQWWGYYKPTQGELDAGTLNITTGMVNEVSRTVSFEVSGAHATTPIADTARSVSTGNRGSAGPVTLTAVTDGTLIISSFSTDDSSTVGAVTPSGTTGWDLLLDDQPASFRPNIVIHALADAAAGNHDTPTYAVTNPDDIGLLAFALEPAAP